MKVILASPSSVHTGTPSKPLAARTVASSAKRLHIISQTMANMKLSRTPGKRFVELVFVLYRILINYRQSFRGDASSRSCQKEIVLGHGKKGRISIHLDITKLTFVKGKLPTKIVIIESSDEESSDTDRNEGLSHP